MTDSAVHASSPSHGTDPGAAEPSPASPRPRRATRLGFVAILILADQVTKYLMFQWLSRPSISTPLPDGVSVWFNGHWRVPVLGDFLGLMLSENKGAAWGLGDQVPHLLVISRGLAVVVLAWLLWRAPRRPASAVWAYVLVLAGAAGNLIDNLFRDPPLDHPFGAVRDFIHVYFERFDYHFPTFNVADSCITVGAGLLIFSGMIAPKEPTAEASGKPA